MPEQFDEPVENGQLDVESQEISDDLSIDDTYKDRYRNSLVDTFSVLDASIDDIRVFAVNSQDDLDKLLPQIKNSGVSAEEGLITAFMIKPDSDLFKGVYRSLGEEAKRYTMLPTGIENVADHEREHFDVAKKIKKGNGLANKFGAKNDFLFCLRILVYPNSRNRNGSNFNMPITNVGTLVSYSESMSNDERMAINFEIISAANQSEDGLSPSDKDQLKQIMKLRSDDTPITNQVVEALKTQLPESIFD